MFVNIVIVLEISIKYGMLRLIVLVNNRCEFEVGGFLFWGGSGCVFCIGIYYLLDLVVYVILISGLGIIECIY